MMLAYPVRTSHRIYQSLPSLNEAPTYVLVVMHEFETVSQRALVQSRLSTTISTVTTLYWALTKGTMEKIRMGIGCGGAMWMTLSTTGMRLCGTEIK